MAELGVPMRRDKQERRRALKGPGASREVPRTSHRSKKASNQAPLPSVLMSEVQPEEIRWLWRDRIPLGMLTLLEGDPDKGKSTLALDIVARVTTGQPMPLQAEESKAQPSGVLLWAPEDPAAQVIRPRLDAAQADSTRVRLITGPLTLPDDVPQLESMAREFGATLILLEPLTAAVSGRVDMHRDHDIRRALMPLAEMAKRLGCAVVTIRHLRKGDGPALYRGSGSVAITALARSVLAVGLDPEDKDARIIARTKNNLSPPTGSLRFRLVSADKVARVEWIGTSEVSADELLQTRRPSSAHDRSALEEAEEALRSILASGSVPIPEVEQQTQQAGIKRRTLRRAKESLKNPDPACRRCGC